MQLRTGLGANFALASWPGTAGTNANPNPAGPSTAAEAGFGTTVAGPGSVSAETGLTLIVGTAAVVGLFALWWALPR